MSEAAGAAIDFAEVKRRIPHRYPFLLVDRAEEFQPHESLVGIKNVTANEDFFQGHFPENPVMPGVLIVEALAQTGALLMSKSMEVDPEGKSIYFLSISEARFRATVRPGDTLRLSVKIIRHRGDVYKFRGEAFVEGRIAAEAEFAAMLVENSR